MNGGVSGVFCSAVARWNLSGVLQGAFEFARSQAIQIVRRASAILLAPDMPPPIRSLAIIILTSTTLAQ